MRSLFDEVFGEEFVRRFYGEEWDFPRVTTQDRNKSSFSNGNIREYYVNGILHREDGPAVVYLDKSKPDEYWLKGRVSSKEEVQALIDKKEETTPHYVNVDGKVYNVVGKKKLQEILNLLK
jgi:hypothetical protein